MKRINFKRKFLATTLFIGLVAVATPGFACWGNGAGYGMGAAVTAAQSNTLQGKAATRAAALQKKINAKYAELEAVRAKGSTTVAQLKKLQGELFTLQNQYNTLVGQAGPRYAQVPCTVGYGMRGGYGPMGGMMYGPGRGVMYGRGGGMMYGPNGGPAAGYAPCSY